VISEQIGLDLLRTFVAVCRQGSLSRVAAQSGRTQSALSMQMRRLESLLGRHLFQRTGRGVLPTPEGEIFLGYATRILALGDEAWARLRETAVSGTVRIGLAEEIANSALPVALGRLHRIYPDVQLDVVVEHSMALGPLWEEGNTDIIIAPTSSLGAIDAMVTWNVELQWVSAIDYVQPSDQPLQLVVFAAPCLWRRRMIEALAATGREHRITFTSQSVMGLQAAIENGLGIGLLPPDSIRTETMRTLDGSLGLPEPLTVQYGLYARDRRAHVVDATIDVLLAATSPYGSRSEGPPVVESAM
jgi:DNA-binding transcriptional LysR family regulator